VYVIGMSFDMSGGAVSGNAAVSSSDSARGGGVYVDTDGKFAKQSGGTIIYGSNAEDTLKNTAGNNTQGHAAYVYSGSKKRNSTAGEGITLDSGTDDNWE
jgi:hypothetical protein